MRDKYIQYLSDLDNSEIDFIINELDFNLISFDELQDKISGFVLEGVAYSFNAFEKELKMQEMLGK